MLNSFCFTSLVLFLNEHCPVYTLIERTEVCIRGREKVETLSVWKNTSIKLNACHFLSIEFFIENYLRVCDITNRPVTRPKRTLFTSNLMSTWLLWLLQVSNKWSEGYIIKVPKDINITNFIKIILVCIWESVKQAKTIPSTLQTSFFKQTAICVNGNWNKHSLE